MRRDDERQQALDHAAPAQTRRHFFERCGVGLGAMALGSLLDRDGLSAGRAVADRRTRWPCGPATSRHGRKSVIYLFMAGGPSQLELFDYKPELQKFTNQPIPDSFIKGRRFAFMDIFTKEHPKLLGTIAPVRPPRPVRRLGLGVPAPPGRGGR